MTLEIGKTKNFLENIWGFAFLLIVLFAMAFVFIPQSAHAAAFDITELDQLDHTATSSNNGSSYSLTKIDDTHYMLAYGDDNETGYLTTFSIDGSYVITELDTLTSDSNVQQYPELIQIDATHFMLAYTGVDDDGFIKTFSIDGSYNITEIDSLEHDTALGDNSAIVQLDSTHFALAYESTSGARMKTFSVDGSYNITEIDNHAFLNDTIYWLDIMAFDSTHVMVAVQYFFGTEHAYVYTFSIDGSYNVTTIDNHKFAESAGSYNSIAKIDDTHAIVATADGLNGYLRTFSVDENFDNIAEIDEHRHVASQSTYNSLIGMDATTYVLAYTGTGGNTGQIATFSLDQNYLITEESSLQHDAGNTYNNSLVKIDETHFILATMQFTETSDRINTFSIEAAPFALSTEAATNIATSSATVSGFITGSGGNTVTAQGFAWGTNSGLSGGDTATTTTYGTFDVGAFSDVISSLNKNEVVYFRAFAATSAGTTTGSILSFNTDGVEQVGSSTGVQQGSVSTSWSHSHALPVGGKNKALLIGVLVSQASSTDDVSAVTYDGVSATQLTEAFGGLLDPGLSIWWMPEEDLPAGGSSYTLAVTINNARAGQSVLSLFDSVDQSEPTNDDSVYQVDQDASDHTENLTGVLNGSIVVAYLNDEGGPPTASVSDGTEIYDSNDGGSACGDEGDCFVAINSGSGTVGVTWTNTSSSGGWEKTTGIVELIYSTSTPTVTTDAASSVTDASANVNGNITITGGENNTERGFAWGTGSGLSGGDTATTSEFGSFGTGAFSAATSSLSAGTTYYFRAFSANTVGTSTGSILNFTTSFSAPTVQTDAADTVTSSTANINGDITATGGENNTERGFAWGTGSGLSGGDTATTSEFGSFGTGAFSDALSSLDPGITYYFRAFSTNSAATSTGVIRNFTTSTVAPTVSTDAATNVRNTSSVINGDITNTGGENNNERGFAWGTNSGLSGGDTATTTSFGSFSTGTFSDALSSLTTDATYYFRAYSANTVGTSTGSILSFIATTPSRKIRIFEGAIMRILDGTIKIF